MSPLLSQSALLAARVLPLLLAAPAFAEAPMNVDDAGTLALGGMKVEGGWHKDDRTRGFELVFGFSPLDKLEVAIAAGRDRDHTDDPATNFNGYGIGFKWVPIQNDTGWSFGASLDLGRTRVTDYVTPDQYNERGTAINGLASWRAEAGHTVHLNLGTTRTDAQGVRDNVGTWGAGYEHSLADNLRLTAEVFGEEHSRPDKAVGLRYEIAAGLKISAAVGRGNDRNFGQAGVAWEF